MKNNKKMIIILAIVAIVAVIAITTTTFALFTSVSDSDAKTFKSGTLTIEYDKNGRQINGATLVPIVNKESAETHTFTVTNTGSIDATYSIDFTKILLTKRINDVTTDITSSNLKWELYKAIKIENDYSIDTTASYNGVVASGNFSNYDTTDSGNYKLPIINNLDLLASGKIGDSQSYILRVWLANAEDNTNDQGMSFSAQITVTATQK